MIQVKDHAQFRALAREAAEKIETGQRQAGGGYVNYRRYTVDEMTNIIESTLLRALAEEQEQARWDAGAFPPPVFPILEKP